MATLIGLMTGVTFQAGVGFLAADESSATVVGGKDKYIFGKQTMKYLRKEKRHQPELRSYPIYLVEFIIHKYL